MKKDVWARLEEKAKEASEGWRIEQITPQLVPWKEFFYSYTDIPPKDILSRVATMRTYLGEDILLSPELKEKIDNELDSREIEIRQSVLLSMRIPYKELLPDMKPYNKASKNEKKNGAIFLFNMSQKKKFKKALLERLKEMSDKKGTVFQEAIKTPTGKKLVRKADKLIASYKNWPVLAQAIVYLYRLLLPLYPAKNRKPIKNRKNAFRDELARYPQALLEDILEILKMEFLNLDDLTVADIKSRIEYASKSNELRALTLKDFRSDRTNKK